jgi:hypothetical protein
VRIHNVHERTLPIDQQQAWELVDSLGTQDDRLWPHHRWPRMSREADNARHAFVTYRVVGREPGASLRFRFQNMRGIDGEHAFEVLPAGANASVLRHTMTAQAHGRTELAWRLFIERMHDALLEDLLDGAEGRPPRSHGSLIRIARGISASIRLVPYRRT